MNSIPVATKSGRPRTAAITRDEFSRLEARVEELMREYSLQFSRITQMQAELDQIQTAWTKRRARAAGPTR